jgi:uroporphyrinogen decarboxylase
LCVQPGKGETTVDNQTPITKRERLERIFAGEMPDRPAVALWRHWPVDDQQGDTLARATLQFQQTFDFDFIKVTPGSDYSVHGYGARSRWLGNLEGTREYENQVIHQPEDWRKLRPLSPHEGLLGEVLVANQLIGQEVDAEVPFIQTIFNPLSQAKNLAGDRLLPHLRLYPDAVAEGLAVLTESIVNFIEALKKTGAAGIFLAVQHAQLNLLTEAEYTSIARPLDMQILEATQGMWFNLLHLHGQDVMFDLMADYPVQVINWHDQETPPTLSDALKRTDKTLCGGLRQWETMVRGGPDDVLREANAAAKSTGGRRFILGTGCVTPIVAPVGNILAARHAVEALHSE